MNEALKQYTDLMKLGFTEHQARAIMTANAIKGANESKLAVAEAVRVSADLEERKVAALESIATVLTDAALGPNYGLWVRS